MLHVAMGWEYRDRYVRQGAVVYCAFEGAHGYKKRVEALRRHYAIDAAARPLYVMPGQANLIAEHRLLIADIADSWATQTRRRGARHPQQEPGRLREQGRRHGGLCPRRRGHPRHFGCVVDHRPSLRLRRHPPARALVAAGGGGRPTVRYPSEEVITVTVEMMRDGPEDTQVVSASRRSKSARTQNGKILTSLVVVPSDADPGQRSGGTGLAG